MRALITIGFLFIISLQCLAQAPVLAVNRIDKFTKELIKQTSLYSLKDGSGVTKVHFSVQSVDENYYLQFNVPQAVTIKKGTTITVTLENGKALNLISNNDIISLSEADISKRMIVCTLDDAEIKDLLKLQVNTIKIPTSNKGDVSLTLLTKDRPMIRTAMVLVSPKLKAK